MLSLSPGDVQQLGATMRLLLSPHDFENATDWRLAICEHLVGWLQTDGVHLTLTGSASPPLVGVGRWGSTEAREYANNWHNHQEVDTELRRRNQSVWVRDEVISPSDFRRTRYYSEFCGEVRNLDSAGIWHTFLDGADAVLHFNSARNGTFPVGGRTHTVISLLHPALVAGATALRALGEGDSSGLLDASGRWIALLTLDGRLQHMTPSLAAMASDPVMDAALRKAMKQLAVEAGRLWRTASSRKPVIPSLKIAVREKWLVVTASIVRERLTSAAPICLVTVTTAGPAQPDASASEFPLTPRERQVAERLARGERNREIAAALRITEHTARRHTERVLTKLGVRSRAAVAGMLARSSASPRGSAESA